MLNNHLRFTILYHRDLETDLARIVGFEVEPFSVKHSYEGTWDATGLPSAMPHMPCPAYLPPDGSAACSPACHVASRHARHAHSMRRC